MQSPSSRSVYSPLIYLFPYHGFYHQELSQQTRTIMFSKKKKKNRRKLTLVIKNFVGTHCLINQRSYYTILEPTHFIKHLVGNPTSPHCVANTHSVKEKREICNYSMPTSHSSQSALFHRHLHHHVHPNSSSFFILTLYLYHRRTQHDHYLWFVSNQHSHHNNHMAIDSVKEPSPAP